MLRMIEEMIIKKDLRKWHCISHAQYFRSYRNLINRWAEMNLQRSMLFRPELSADFQSAGNSGKGLFVVKVFDLLII